jgi:arylsulfatase A-like enzyme
MPVKSIAMLIAVAVVSSTSDAATAADARPNIVFILCDDLGYGDVRCLNPQGRIDTPNMDRIAREGMIFSDAHSGSAVCSPTRYGLITGRYAWRSRLQQGVLGGLSPRLIERGHLTVAALLKDRGYHTACFGKWHLGMDWIVHDGKKVTELGIETPDQVWNVDYSQPIANGPNAVGFDEYFGISASLDMVPYTFIEDDHVAVLPTAEKEFPMVLGRAGDMTRKGPAAPDFEAGGVLPALTRRAVDYINRRGATARSGNPFFLYLPLASPHTPIEATPEWRGKSGLNAYADFVMQTDFAIGRVLAALDEQKLAGNTLVLMASDNGCSPYAQFDELLAKGHNPNSIFRGNKADIFEGGHHVPLLVRWPAKVKPGTTSDRLVWLGDFMAMCAEIVGATLPAGAGEDSVSFLPALRQSKDESPRAAVVHHSSNGSFAIREGAWKLILCPGSGGWSAPRPGRDDTSGLPLIQLYELTKDAGELHNAQAEYPEVVMRLTAQLERYVAEGRSTPGAMQANAVAVDIWKAGKAAHQPLQKKP